MGVPIDRLYDFKGIGISRMLNEDSVVKVESTKKDL